MSTLTIENSIGTSDGSRRLSKTSEKPCRQSSKAVSHSATLLVILSESYLTSEWCQRELTLFLQAAAQTGSATGRIFLVRVDALDHNRWPEAFHGLLGQKFFEQANVDAPARTLGTPLANDPEKRLYFQRLDDLSRELATKLLEMKQASEP